MSGSSRVVLPELPSLTGLRFWAAFSILVNHLLLGFVARNDIYLATMLNAASWLGMSVFFVLSGFIIHYNYHQKLDDFRLGSFYDFIVARFSRLYPLYFVIFLVEFFTASLGRYDPAELWKALIFFLTMSQSWFYWKLEAGPNVAYVFDRFSISWSISTEFLMYCGYPLVLWVFVRDRTSHRVRILASLAICLACAVFIRLANNNVAAVDAWGVRTFGERVGMAVSPSHSFAFWLTFISPYIRFFEFIIGAVVAHNFLRLRDVPVGPREGLIMPLLGVLSLMFIIGTFLPADMQPRAVFWLYANVGYFPAIACIVFVCARYDFAFVTRFFERRFFVFFGECSYSMYLIHIFIYSMAQHTPATPLQTVVRILVLWATVFACSYVLYSYIEMPARRWLRNALSRRQTTSATGTPAAA